MISASESANTLHRQPVALLFCCDAEVPPLRWLSFADYFCVRGVPCYAWQCGIDQVSSFARDELSSTNSPTDDTVHMENIPLNLALERLKSSKLLAVAYHRCVPILAQHLLHEEAFSWAAYIAPPSTMTLKLNFMEPPDLPVWLGLGQGHRPLMWRSRSNIEVHHFYGLRRNLPFTKGWERVASTLYRWFAG